MVISIREGALEKSCTPFGRTVGDAWKSPQRVEGMRGVKTFGEFSAVVCLNTIDVHQKRLDKVFQ